MRTLARSLWLAEPSRFAGLPRGQARAVLAFVALFLLATMTALVAPAPPLAGHDPARRETDQGDIVTYENIIERVRHGEAYYPVAADTLRHGDYPLRPFFTFRLPTLAVLLAMLPAPWRPVPMYLLSVAVLIAWATRLRAAFARRPPLLIALLLLAAGALSGLQAGLVSFHDVWAGLFIALSLALRRRGRWIESVAFGVCAMLVRELAAPYVLVMAAAAWGEGDRREAAGWIGALALFAAILAAHAHAVAGVLHPTDPASPGWAGLLGLGFFVKAVVLSTGLQIAPPWLAAPLVGLSLVGWAAWRDALGLRVIATLATYALLIAAGARVDNFYWALLVAPVSLVGLAFVPDAARDLVRAARDTRRITVTRMAR